MRVSSDSLVLKPIYSNLLSQFPRAEGGVMGDLTFIVCPKKKDEQNKQKVELCRHCRFCKNCSPYQKYLQPELPFLFNPSTIENVRKQISRAGEAFQRRTWLEQGEGPLWANVKSNTIFQGGHFFIIFVGFVALAAYFVLCFA
jgi:hypothetical protein